MNLVGNSVGAMLVILAFGSMAKPVEAAGELPPLTQWTFGAPPPRIMAATALGPREGDETMARLPPFWRLQRQPRLTSLLDALLPDSDFGLDELPTLRRGAALGATRAELSKRWAAEGGYSLGGETYILCDRRTGQFARDTQGLYTKVVVEFASIPPPHDFQEQLIGGQSPNDVIVKISAPFREFVLNID